jgi:hypothetical protein
VVGKGRLVTGFDATNITDYELGCNERDGKFADEGDKRASAELRSSAETVGRGKISNLRCIWHL